MTVDLNRRTYDLLRLVDEEEPVGSIRLVELMTRRGYSIKGRTIRVVLSELDEAGLTEKVPGKGRRLTEEGRAELSRGNVTGRRERIRERIATLTSRVTYDPLEDAGEVVSASVTVPAADLGDAFDSLERLDASPLGPVLVSVDEGPDGSRRLVFPSSITLDGVLLAQGIAADLTTAGLVEYETDWEGGTDRADSTARPATTDREDTTDRGDASDREAATARENTTDRGNTTSPEATDRESTARETTDREDATGQKYATGVGGSANYGGEIVRYVDAISGEGSTMDVVSLLIEAGRTNVSDVVTEGSGLIVVDNREFPLNRYREAADLSVATRDRLGGVLDLRRPRESGPFPVGDPGWDFASLSYSGMGEVALALFAERDTSTEWTTLAGLVPRSEFSPVREARSSLRN